MNRWQNGSIHFFSYLNVKDTVNKVLNGEIREYKTTKNFSLEKLDSPTSPNHSTNPLREVDDQRKQFLNFPLRNLFCPSCTNSKGSGYFNFKINLKDFYVVFFNNLENQE